MDKAIIRRTKTALTSIADILYKGEMDHGMAEMNRVIPDLALIADGITDSSLQERLLTDCLAPILEAMENRDATLLADLITYELADLLDTLE